MYKKLNILLAGIFCSMGVMAQERFLLMVREAGFGGIGFTCGGFIRQTAAAIVSCRTHIAYSPTQEKQLEYANLQDAEVRFFPPEETPEEQLEVKSQYFGEHYLPFEWEDTPLGRSLVVRHATGSVFIKW